MELKRTIVTLVLVSILLATFTVLPSVGKPEVMGPNMDAIKFVTVTPMTQPAKLMEGVIDVATVPTLEDWEELEAWGANIYTYPSLSFGFYDFNVAREKLQHRYLRRAMAWLTNVDLAIATSPVLGVLVKRTYSWLPDVYGPWHNPNVERFYSYITAPGDPASVNAINEMIAGGYTAVKIDDAKPVERGNIDHWEKDGEPLPTFNLVYTADWPENKVLAEAWLAELVAHGFDILPECIAFYPTWINRIIWGDPPDYDLTTMDTTWSKIDPIIMDLYFNSEKMPPGACCNWRRWNSSLADSLIETFTTTTNMTKAYKACWDLQDLVASEAIMPAQMMWNTVIAYHPDLMGVRKSAVITDWTLSMFQLKWKTPEARAAHMNTLIYPQVGEPEDLNPNKQAGVWASWLVGLVTDSYGGGFGLTVYDPISMEMKPWGAYDWKVEEYTEGPITGTKITYWLRDDIYWQDHTPENPRPFKADDVKFCLEYLQVSGSAGGQAGTATINLVNVTVKDVGTSSTDPTLDGWNEAIVYHNTTSPFLLYYTSAWAMEFPKHIWEAVPPAEAIAATPWTEPHPIYNTANPHPIHGPLTKLIGTGPFVFLDGAWTPDQETFTANRIYYRSAEASLADTNFDFKVDINDIFTVAKAFGSYIGHPRWKLRADINCDKEVNIIDIFLVAKDFGKTW